MLSRKFVFLNLFLLLSCASVSIPESKKLPSPTELPRYPYGAFIAVRVKDRFINGEILGVEGNTLYVLTTDDKILSIPKDKVRYYNVIECRHDDYKGISEAIGMLVLSGLGAVSSIFVNGWLVLISGSLWLLTGTIGGLYVVLSSNPDCSPEVEWDKLIRYSRYPQGIPQEIKEKAVNY
jgi:hypothetical protein